MKKSESFQMLKDLASEQEQKALQAVADANSRLDHAVRQLKMLEQYRHEYLQKLQNSMVVGTRSSMAANTQRFIDNIDVAIAKQKNQVRTCEQQVMQQKEIWLEQRKKTRSMSTLLEREHMRELKKVVRNEQKRNDEFALQAYRRAKTL